MELSWHRLHSVIRPGQADGLRLSPLANEQLIHVMERANIREVDRFRMRYQVILKSNGSIRWRPAKRTKPTVEPSSTIVFRATIVKLIARPI